MKKNRVGVTIAAFVCCLAGVLVSKATSAVDGVYGHTSLGMCIPATETIQNGCSIDNSGPQCTVYLPGSSLIAPQRAPAYLATRGPSLLRFFKNAKLENIRTM